MIDRKIDSICNSLFHCYLLCGRGNSCLFELWKQLMMHHRRCIFFFGIIIRLFSSFVLMLQLAKKQVQSHYWCRQLVRAPVTSNISNYQYTVQKKRKINLLQEQLLCLLFVIYERKKRELTALQLWPSYNGHDLGSFF
jgi:hypothetical protein